MNTSMRTIAGRIGRLEARQPDMNQALWIQVVQEETESLEEAKARWLEKHPGTSLEGVNLIVRRIVSPPSRRGATSTAEGVVQ